MDIKIELGLKLNKVGPNRQKYFVVIVDKIIDTPYFFSEALSIQQFLTKNKEILKEVLLDERTI